MLYENKIRAGLDVLGTCMRRIVANVPFLLRLSGPPSTPVDRNWRVSWYKGRDALSIAAQGTRTTIEDLFPAAAKRTAHIAAFNEPDSTTLDRIAGTLVERLPTAPPDQIRANLAQLCRLFGNTVLETDRVRLARAVAENSRFAAEIISEIQPLQCNRSVSPRTGSIIADRFFSNAFSDNTGAVPHLLAARIAATTREFGDAATIRKRLERLVPLFGNSICSLDQSAGINLLRTDAEFRSLPDL